MSCNTRTVEAASAAYSTNGYRGVGSQPVKVAQADPGRRSVSIIADADNPGDVYLVDSGTAASTRGLRLAPGAGWTMNTSAAVYVVTAAGAPAATVYVVTESGEVG